MTTVDEALEALTHVTAGEKGPQGKYPEKSANWRVEKRLAEFARARRRAASDVQPPGAPCVLTYSA